MRETLEFIQISDKLLESRRKFSNFNIKSLEPITPTPYTFSFR